LDNAAEHGARAQLLNYQVEELHQLDLQEGELEALELEHNQLANGEQILHACQQTLGMCRDNEINISTLINQALNTLADMSDNASTLANSHQTLREALIQVEEASDDLQRYADGFEQDPQRLQWLEQRLGAIHDIARKHRCQPSQLPGFQQELENELQQLQSSDGNAEELRSELQTITNEYRKVAKKLSNKRLKAAKKLQQDVEMQLAELSMGNCQFRIELANHDDQLLHANGNESVSFLVNTNPGQSLQPLAKIASGGELSRISLAIQVSTAKTSTIPTLVFDEVDVGIGGATAEVVGRLLRELGEQGQVICVTHQPQVASQGQQHLVASKAVKKQQTTTKLQSLDDNSKVDEIARMLGGIAISDHSRAHAKEMLSVAH
jgi:DNA repair protein RecN (Recombination protein N)